MAENKESISEPKKTNKKESTLFGPAVICAIMTVLACLGILLGFHYFSPLLIILFLFPAVIYEVIRTQGESTKSASLIMLAALSVEFLLIVFNINFDLAKFLNMSTFYFQGTPLPLGELKTLIPAAVAVASIVLIKNTRGIYTKWLSIIIIAGSVALIYSLTPDDFAKFAQMGIKTLMNRFGNSF